MLVITPIIVVSLTILLSHFRSSSKFIDDGDVIDFELGSEKGTIRISACDINFIYECFFNEQAIPDMVGSVSEYKGEFNLQ